MTRASIVEECPVPRRSSSITVQLFPVDALSPENPLLDPIGFYCAASAAAGTASSSSPKLDDGDDEDDEDDDDRAYPDVAAAVDGSNAGKGGDGWGSGYCAVGGGVASGKGGGNHPYRNDDHDGGYGDDGDDGSFAYLMGGSGGEGDDVEESGWTSSSAPSFADSMGSLHLSCEPWRLDTGEYRDEGGVHAVGGDAREISSAGATATATTTATENAEDDADADADADEWNVSQGRASYARRNTYTFANHTMDDDFHWSSGSSKDVETDDVVSDIGRRRPATRRNTYTLSLGWEQVREAGRGAVVAVKNRSRRRSVTRISPPPSPPLSPATTFTSTPLPSTAESSCSRTGRTDESHDAEREIGTPMTTLPSKPERRVMSLKLALARELARQDEAAMSIRSFRKRRDELSSELANAMEEELRHAEAESLRKEEDREAQRRRLDRLTAEVREVQKYIDRKVSEVEALKERYLSELAKAKKGKPAETETTKATAKTTAMEQPNPKRPAPSALLQRMASGLMIGNSIRQKKSARQETMMPERRKSIGSTEREKRGTTRRGSLCASQQEQVTASIDSLERDFWDGLCSTAT